MAEEPRLLEVYSSQNPVVDIVAIHGLNGDARRTWTTPKTDKFWLADLDMLPAHLHNARILTYGYNATVASICGKTSSDRIMQHAHTLIAELVANRQLNDAEQRPIIFICHSLGGIIVKRALAYAAGRTSKSVEDYHFIYISTYAIIFMGTPHHGSNKAHMASVARRIVAATLPSKAVDTDGQLLDALKQGSETLQTITDMFVPLMKSFRIYYFWEQEKTNFGPTKDYVVEEPSAAPIMYDTERAGLPYDHRGMVRFESPVAPGYAMVVAALKRYTRDAPDKIARRQSHARQQLRASRENEASELVM